MTIFIWINKSITANTYYRIIFSIIIGLLFSFTSQIVFAQSTSVSGDADQRGTTVVSYKDKDWVEKKISFLKLSELPKEQKDHITSQQKRSKQTEFDDFELQVVNQRIAWIDGALNQVRLAQNVMIEISRDAKNTIETPQTRSVNMAHAKILKDALNNPLVVEGLPKRTIYIMSEASKHLATWRNIVYIDQKVLDEINKQ